MDLAEIRLIPKVVNKERCLARRLLIAVTVVFKRGVATNPERKKQRGRTQEADHDGLIQIVS
jgi:hypothetical protein